MRLTDERHEEIDTSLQHIHEYLTALTAELDAAASETDKQGYTHPVAVTATAWVAQLRQALQTEREHPSASEESR